MINVENFRCLRCLIQIFCHLTEILNQRGLSSKNILIVLKYSYILAAIDIFNREEITRYYEMISVPPFPA